MPSAHVTINIPGLDSISINLSLRKFLNFANTQIRDLHGTSKRTNSTLSPEGPAPFAATNPAVTLSIVRFYKDISEK
jgi:hypothetical protein